MIDGRKVSIAIRSSKKLARETSKITWHSSCSRFPHHTDIEWTTAGDHQERVKDTHYRTVPKSLEGHDKCKELPEAEGPSQPRADYYRRERRDWGTHAYTGGDLPTKPNRFPVFGPQKSVTCAGRVFSSVENSSFRMSSLLGLFVGNQRKLGWMASFGRDTQQKYLLHGSSPLRHGLLFLPRSRFWWLPSDGLVIHQTSMARRGPANSRAVAKQHILFLPFSLLAPVRRAAA